VRGQKNEFHALEKFYNYFPQSSIEEIDNAILIGKVNKVSFLKTMTNVGTNKNNNIATLNLSTNFKMEITLIRDFNVSIILGAK
jgi:hypothetical protein